MKLKFLLFLSIFSLVVPSIWAQECTELSLRTSTVAVSENDQVIENLDIVVSGTNGIDVNGFTGVTIRNCRISYTQGSRGISFSNSPNLTIEDVEVFLSDAPATGTLADFNSECIFGFKSDNVVINRVIMRDGASGIRILESSDPTITFAEGYNFRGPFPRGQFIQFDKVTNGLIEDFYTFNDLDISFTEDNINFFKSGGQTVRRGVIDGNNAPNGVGVLWEDQNKDDAVGVVGGLVEDVDLVNMGNGAVSGADGSSDIIMQRIRVKGTHCEGVGGRAAPSSGGLPFSGFGAPDDRGMNLKVIACVIDPDVCYPENFNQIFPQESFTEVDFVREAFVPNTGIRNTLDFCVNEAEIPIAPPIPVDCAKLTETFSTTSATADNQVIENLDIVVSGANGIEVNGFSGVTIRNCRISYTQGSRGISFSNAPNLTIDRVEVFLSDAPETGALADFNSECIFGFKSDDVTITSAKMTDGASGIRILESSNPTITFAEGYNFRGPFPRGQFIQFDKVVGGVIQDFYNFNDLDISFTEDNINFFKSGGQTVRRGLIDGNNAPNGTGVLWEDQNKEDAVATGGLVQDVDLVNMGNGAVTGADGSSDIVIRRVRVKGTHCEGVGGRAAPSSGGLPFSGFGAPDDRAMNLSVIDCTIDPDVCYPANFNQTFPSESFTVVDFKREAFVPFNANQNTFNYCPPDPVGPTEPEVPTVCTELIKQTVTFVATADNEVIENLDIVVEGANGIEVNGFSGVTIKNCRISYTQGFRGISFNGADNLRIEQVEVFLSDAPETGTLSDFNSECVFGFNSDNLVVFGLKMTDGASGLRLLESENPNIKFAEGYNFRGPFPRGQFIQFDKVVGGVIEDFYNFNDLDISFTEDNINFFKSGGQTVRRGIIDGNNAPNGTGILWEDQNKPDAVATGGLVFDVDLVNMGNGAVTGADGSSDIVIRNVRVKGTHCEGVGGRAAPSSGGLPFSGFGAPGDTATNLQVINSTLDPDVCYPANFNQTFPSASFTVVDIKREAFEPRAGIRNTFLYCEPEERISGIFNIKLKGTDLAVGPEYGDLWGGAITELDEYYGENYQKYEITPLEDGKYQFRNVASNKCLKVKAKKDRNNTRIRQRRCDTVNPSKQFLIEEVGEYYQIKSVLFERSLHIKNRRIRPGAKVVLFDSDSTNHRQLFTFTEDSVTTYKKYHLKATLPDELPAETSDLTLYPNPTSTYFMVDMNQVEGGIMNIFDMNGIEVMNASLDAGENEINVSTLSAGLYFVKVNTALGVQVKRLIIE